MSRHFKRTNFDKQKQLIASALQKKYYEQEALVSSFYLGLKICFFLIATISLTKIGYISKIRMARLKEINESYLYEKSRFGILSSRLDNLLSSNGKQRFMKDQDQMISRDLIRVIWR